MTDSARKSATAMSTSRKCKSITISNYALGDLGKPEDVVDHGWARDDLTAFIFFKPDDYCFVRRSSCGGNFTFAKVLSCEHGLKPRMKLQVETNGSTKSIPINKCAKLIRPLQPMMEQQQNPFSLLPPHSQACSRESQRTRSEIETLPLELTITTTASKSLVEVERRPTIEQRISSFKRLSNLRASIQSELGDTNKMRSTFARRASTGAFSQYIVNIPGQRRQSSHSRCGVNVHSSITTHSPEDAIRKSHTIPDVEEDWLGGDSSLNEASELDLEAISEAHTELGEEGRLNSFSMKEDHHAIANLQDLVVKNKDLVFDQENLLVALHSIVPNDVLCAKD